MFNIGKDADEAQALIVAYLKSKQKGPLGQLAQAERRELDNHQRWCNLDYFSCWHTSYRTEERCPSCPGGRCSQTGSSHSQTG